MDEIKIKTFTPRSLSERDKPFEYQEVKKEFGSLASTDPSADMHFSLHPAAKRLLGIEREELTHIEDRVQSEVVERLKVIHDEAYQKGYDEGALAGRKKSEAEAAARFTPMLEQLDQTMLGFDALKQDLYRSNEKFLIQLIFGIAKEVLLRDLKADPDYVKRLTSTVIAKIGAKESIRVKFNRADFANVEQIRDFVKSQFPELKNIQIEAADDLELGGCKVETDLSRINASVETQLKAIESNLVEEQ